MAKYDMSVSRNLKGGLAIKSEGYTFEFRHNFKEWKRFTKKRKQEARTWARNLLVAWAEFIAVEAKKRAPHFSGGLERAIQVGAYPSMVKGTSFATSRMKIAVGVNGNAWESSYDDVTNYLVGKGIAKSEMLAGPQLAVLIHDYWDNWEHKAADKRAERKGSRFGVRVGGGFLSRAYEENKDAFQNIINTLKKNKLARSQSLTRFSTVGIPESDYPGFDTDGTAEYGGEYTGEF